MTPAVIEPSEIVSAPRRAPATRGPRRRRGAERAQRGAANVGLWIPTTLLFALLAPFALLILPFLYMAPRHVIPSPPRMIAGVGALLLSMGGTVVEVDTPDCRIRLCLF